MEIPENAGKYIPTAIKEQIINYIFQEMPVLELDTQWWHLIKSQGKSFIFLHDFSEPRQIELDVSATFIKTDAGLFPFP